MFLNRTFDYENILVVIYALHFLITWEYGIYNITDR